MIYEFDNRDANGRPWFKRVLSDQAPKPAARCSAQRDDRNVTNTQDHWYMDVGVWNRMPPGGIGLEFEATELIPPVLYYEVTEGAFSGYTDKGTLRTTFALICEDVAVLCEWIGDDADGARTNEVICGLPQAVEELFPKRSDSS